MACALIKEAEGLLRKARAIVGVLHQQDELCWLAVEGSSPAPSACMTWHDCLWSKMHLPCPCSARPAWWNHWLKCLQTPDAYHERHNDYWNLISTECKHSLHDHVYFPWYFIMHHQMEILDPDKICTGKLPNAVTLLPQHEHLVWGKLSSKVPLSPNSMIMKLCTSKSRLWYIFVEWVITVGALPKPITLKHPKVSDISHCIAVEDHSIPQGSCKMENRKPEQSIKPTTTDTNFKDRLLNLGLINFDMKSCHASLHAKREFVELVEEYEDIFSRYSLDCVEAKGFVHIRVTDDHLFCKPYRRVQPAHYQQLRQGLADMDDEGIICKSMDWKKDGGLRLCTNLRWLNAQTPRNAHPLSRLPCRTSGHRHVWGRQRILPSHQDQAHF